jgi:hypothetical protein
MLGERRCDRSAMPVLLGVNTMWPAARSLDATRAQIQPPEKAPGTSTNVYVAPWAFAIELEPVNNRVAAAALVKTCLRSMMLSLSDHACP